MQLALAAAVLVIFAGGGAFAWWQDKQETKQRVEREQKAEQARQGVESGLALAVSLRLQYRFEDARSALASALESARGGALDRIAEVEQAQRDLEFVIELDDIRYRKWIWIAESSGRGRFNLETAAPTYHKAFAVRGLDLTALGTDEAAGQIAASG